MGYTDLVKQVLLESPQAATEADNKGQTPFMLASADDRDDILELFDLGTVQTLVQMTDDSLGKTALHFACEKNAKKSMVYFFKNVASECTSFVNTRDHEGRTSLWIAIESMYHSMYSIIMEMFSCVTIDRRVSILIAWIDTCDKRPTNLPFQSPKHMTNDGFTTIWHIAAYRKW